MKISMTRIFTFDAAHRLPYHRGKCASLHGHTYKLEVTVSGPLHPVRKEDPESGMIMDFGELSEVVDTTILGVSDHSHLNDAFVYPTAELMAMTFFDNVRNFLTAWEDLSLERVRLWETPTSYVEVTK